MDLNATAGINPAKLTAKRRVRSDDDAAATKRKPINEVIRV